MPNVTVQHLSLNAFMKADEALLAKSKSYIWGTIPFLMFFVLHYLFLYGTIYFDSYFLKFVFGMLCALTIAQLFILGHDASHGSLTPSHLLNRTLARIAFLPSLHSLSLWDYGHNYLHHRFNLLKGKDNGLVPLSLEEYRALPNFQQRKYQFFRSPIGVLFWYLVESWWIHMFIPPPANKLFLKPDDPILGRKCDPVVVLDSLLLGTYFFGLCFGMKSLAESINPEVSLLSIVLFSFLVPFLLWNFLMSIVSYVHHTHPDIPWFDDYAKWEFFQAQIQGATHVTFSWYFNLVLLNIMDHGAHYFMKFHLPFYRVKAVQRKLEEKYTPHIVAYTRTVPEYQEICRRCKLFDFENSRWLDINGKPTTCGLL